MPLFLVILKRLLAAIPTLLAVSILGFALMRFDFGVVEIPWIDGQRHVIALKNPIDPLASLKRNPALTIEDYERERRRLGLDQPLHIQYGLWLGRLLHFEPLALAQGRWLDFFKPDLGKNFNNEDVATLLAQRAGNTLLLNALVILLTWLIALPLGVFAALRWRSLADRALTLISAVGMAAPRFVVALLVGVWIVKTGWLPLGGITSDNFTRLGFWDKLGDLAAHLIAPVAVLTFGGIAGLQRQMRGNLLDVLQSEYVRLARAKGLPEGRVVYRHAVRTAINPMITMLGYEFSSLLSGALLVEMVLNYPGLGQLTYKAALETDANMVMASLILSAAMLALGNLLADILLKLADPRIEASV
ncbi:MAG: ABC transporter permease [Vampirovibrionales bacterium]|nr:ABC transporter permease [Vampirovibrionales bacterium]